jgi:hypothetical protein
MRRHSRYNTGYLQLHHGCFLLMLWSTSPRRPRNRHHQLRQPIHCLVILPPHLPACQQFRTGSVLRSRKMASTKRTWPSTSTNLSRSMVYATLPSLVSVIWKLAPNAVARRVKKRKSVRTLSTDHQLTQQLAESDATADSRANEITDPRKEDSGKVVNTKPETDAKHASDHKILVVIIQDISSCSYIATCFPLPHGLSSLSQPAITKLSEPISYLAVAARVVKDFHCEGPTKAFAVHRDPITWKDIQWHGQT